MRPMANRLMRKMKLNLEILHLFVRIAHIDFVTLDEYTNRVRDMLSLTVHSFVYDICEIMSHLPISMRIYFILVLFTSKIMVKISFFILRVAKYKM